MRLLSGQMLQGQLNGCEARSCSVPGLSVRGLKKKDPLARSGLSFLFHVTTLRCAEMLRPSCHSLLLRQTSQCVRLWKKGLFGVHKSGSVMVIVGIANVFHSLLDEWGFYTLDGRVGCLQCLMKEAENGRGRTAP